jgi:hypothetical protein
LVIGYWLLVIGYQARMSRDNGVTRLKFTL